MKSLQELVDLTSTSTGYSTGPLYYWSFAKRPFWRKAWCSSRHVFATLGGGVYCSFYLTEKSILFLFSILGKTAAMFYPLPPVKREEKWIALTLKDLMWSCKTEDSWIPQGYCLVVKQCVARDINQSCHSSISIQDWFINSSDVMTSIVVTSWYQW